MHHTLRNRLQLAAGLAFWLVLACWAVSGLLSQTTGSPGTLTSLTGSLSRWAAGSSREIHSASSAWILLAANDPVLSEGIAQVLFFEGEPPEVSYADRKGKYQAQRGITLPKL